MQLPDFGTDAAQGSGPALSERPGGEMRRRTGTTEVGAPVGFAPPGYRSVT